MGDDVHVLPSQLVVPGVGSIPINSFVLLSDQPVLVDTGLGVDGDEFVRALSTVIDPAELAWIWLSHDDLDHTGNLRTLLELAPSARLATHGLGALRMNSSWPVPLERVHALAPGDRLDVGDRQLVALRPPTYDNPMSTGFLDESTGTLFPVDSFGAILGGPHQAFDEIADDELLAGMTAWATFDSPWLHLTDRARLDGVLGELRAIGAERIVPSHLPPVLDGADRLLDVLATIPDAEPFVPPSADDFAEVVAAMTAPPVAAP
ncbi:MBL fold metallo-hydrolase [Dermatobacter hominis]|uniref:MBL fold metallo-hydrolase n=1 Tax=Dermatobacter hominis TaxID=2884263 RepID=UPI001D124054|nr:MBL fold metallo-hydrolase [Dermatobacter hominis]UDY34976.1 MBL fold metallo-hydrolase [Dermatobacter hominis]